jgi:hypothetical protein
MATATPSSVRFEPRVLERLNAFVAAHREMSLSSASNRLVDEALRMHEHPLVTFKDGPAGPFLRAALAYWGDYPEEVDAFIDRARAEVAQAQARAGWERQQELLGRRPPRAATSPMRCCSALLLGAARGPDHRDGQRAGLREPPAGPRRRRGSDPRAYLHI